jgi:hypothetical protein
LEEEGGKEGPGRPEGLHLTDSGVAMGSEPPRTTRTDSI